MVKTLISKFIGKFIDDAPARERAHGNEAEPVGGTDGAQNPVDQIDLVGFVEFVVRGLVDNQNDVVIESTENGSRDVIKINCNKNEIRKIIGKNGKTIQSIRTLVRGAAKRLQKNVSVVVCE